jgi:hypothetical protein
LDFLSTLAFSILCQTHLGIESGLRASQLRSLSGSLSVTDGANPSRLKGSRTITQGGQGAGLGLVHALPTDVTNASPCLKLRHASVSQFCARGEINVSNVSQASIELSRSPLCIGTLFFAQPLLCPHALDLAENRGEEA